MKITIERIYLKTGYHNLPETTTSRKDLSALLHYENGEIPYGENNQTPNQLIISEEDLSSLIPLLKMDGTSGHIPLNEWLKDNKSQFYKRHVNLPDKNGVARILLIELQNYLQINPEN